MSYTVTTSPNGTAARVEGIDVGNLDETAGAKVDALFANHPVLAFSNQQLDEGGLLRFAARFGELEENVASSFHHPKYSQITVLSNMRGADGKRTGSPDAGQGWHTAMACTPGPIRRRKVIRYSI